MLLFSLGRHLSIAFALLSIFGCISVTFSAVIPPLDASLLSLNLKTQNDPASRAHTPPPTATVSFAKELPEGLDGYRVSLDEDNRSKLQNLVEEKIAEYIQRQNKKLSILTANDLNVEPRSLCLFHDPDPNTTHCFVPYNITTANKEFEVMTLRMWYKAGTGKPQAKLYRRINGKYTVGKRVLSPKVKFLSFFIVMSQIDKRSKSVIVIFTTEAQTIPAIPEAKTVALAGKYRGLLDILDLPHVIVRDSLAGVERPIAPEDVQVEGCPSVLATPTHFIIPYKILYGSDKPVFSRDQLELVLKMSGPEPQIQLRRTGTTPAIWYVDTEELDPNILREVIEIGMEATKSGKDDMTKLSQLMENLVGADWKDTEKLRPFIGWHMRPDDPHKGELLELLEVMDVVVVSASKKKPLRDRPYEVRERDEQVGWVAEGEVTRLGVRESEENPREAMESERREELGKEREGEAGVERCWTRFSSFATTRTGSKQESEGYWMWCEEETEGVAGVLRARRDGGTGVATGEG
ncbi:hypothetical protein EV360DRAFT_76201 [Lentinula raphanica]|nr:hypothetical protein EV360DRAFT_76201 [Lentinula raphanica]